MARVALTAPAAGAGVNADTPFTWPTGFADVNYTVASTCTTGGGATIAFSFYGITVYMRFMMQL
jgi:hypothetical protein